MDIIRTYIVSNNLINIIEFSMSDSELSQLNKIDFLFTVEKVTKFKFLYSIDKFKNVYKSYKYFNGVRWLDSDKIRKIESVKKVLDRYIKLKIISQF